MLFFNFLSCPSGGALQNAISFLNSLLEINYNFSKITCFVFTDSPLENFCIENNVKYISVKNKLIHKIFAELTLHKKLKKNDIVFSIFGPPLFFSHGKSINIGGMAISNVLHKEIDFWGFLGEPHKSIKKLKDWYRCKRYATLDYWIFETDLLYERAIKNANIPENRATVVKMAPSKLVAPSKIKNITFKPFDHKQYANYKKLLFLAGAHPNKRQHLIPQLLLDLKSKGMPTVFILTAKKNEYLVRVLEEAKKLGVEDLIINIGPIPPNNVASLINQVDAICTFSLLESFSNNFVEAWVMKKPLIVTDSEWSRRSCLDAALYIEPSNSMATAQSINELFTDKTLLETIVNEGNRNIMQYPSPVDKVKLYLQCINEVEQLGVMQKELRKKVKF